VWQLLGKKTLTFYPNSFLQVAKYFFRSKIGDKSQKEKHCCVPIKNNIIILFPQIIGASQSKDFG
jgi:hypothetical protein